MTELTEHEKFQDFMQRFLKLSDNRKANLMAFCYGAYDYHERLHLLYNQLEEQENSQKIYG
jgi:hypothetical protein